VAIAGRAELQATVAPEIVRPSPPRTVAVSCTVAPTDNELADGVTVTEPGFCPSGGALCESSPLQLGAIVATKTRALRWREK
jgi:hypothetical protein